MSSRSLACGRSNCSPQAQTLKRARPCSEACICCACFLWLSWQAPRSCRLAYLLNRKQIRRERLAVGELGTSIAAFRVKKIKQTRCAVPVSVFAYVARLLRRVQIARAIEADDLIVGAQIFKSVPYIRKNLAVREFLLLLGLRNRITGARNFSLIAIENRQLDLPKQ